MGLGYYSTHQLAPALQQTEHCRLAGIVTGTPEKIPVWKKKYGIPDENIYSYNNYDSIISNPEIDVIYIVLPNHLHAEYSIRGFRAGKHVICEKPMALSVNECDAMLVAAEKANKNLSIGYRLHFDTYNLELIRLVQEKVYGEIKSIDTAFCITPQKGEWRLDKKIAGGGPLMDVGIYCLQAVCYVTGQSPVAVTAQSFPVSDVEKFKDIEEIITWQMEMPGGLLATCKTSYSEQSGFLKVITENGWLKLDPAFNYDGLQLHSPDGRSLALPPFSQQVRQLDGIALAIKNNQSSIVPGSMGRRDMKIIAAVYEAMQSGKRVEINY